MFFYFRMKERPQHLMGPHHPAGGDACSDGGGAGGGFLVELISRDEVDGQRDLHSVLLGFGHQVFDDGGALLVKQRRTDLTGQ